MFPFVKLEYSNIGAELHYRDTLRPWVFSFVYTQGSEESLSVPAKSVSDTSLFQIKDILTKGVGANNVYFI